MSGMCVCWYSCVKNKINVRVTIDKYTERDVRLHISRLRDLLGGPYKPNPSSIGIDPAISFLTAITGEIGKCVYERKDNNGL